MVQGFYNNLSDDENTFLGHHFVESDVDDGSDFGDDESDGVPEQEPIEDDWEEKDSDDGEVAEIVGNDNDNAQIEPVVNDADDANIDDPMPAELPKKQKFKNLDEDLDEDSYVDLLAQRKRTFKYADAKNTIPAKISTLFQRCLLADTTSRRGISLVYFNVDMNNVR